VLNVSYECYLFAYFTDPIVYTTEADESSDDEMPLAAKLKTSAINGTNGTAVSVKSEPMDMSMNGIESTRVKHEPLNNNDSDSDIPLVSGCYYSILVYELNFNIITGQLYQDSTRNYSCKN
jgi:hypothetical protein